MHNNSPLVSIVANFYNSERYIPRLIESVINQTYDNWELICVNDSSLQNDALIISQHIKSPKSKGRIKLINNERNLGICKSKQVGINNANGTYITFIDGDDWFAPKAIESMLEPAMKFNLDLVIMNNYKIIPLINKKWLMFSDVSEYNKPIYTPELFDKYFINFFGKTIFATNSYWGKLYKRELFSKISNWPNNDTYEDNIVNFRLFPFVKSIMFIEYPGYYYRWGGITSGKSNTIYKHSRVINIINEYYIERLNSIYKYNYQKATHLLNCELKNVLKVAISQIAKYKPNSVKANNLVTEIENILSHDAYNHFSEYINSGEKQIDDEIVRYIANRDAKSVYLYCHSLYNKNRMKRLIKRTLHKLSSIILK